MRPLFIVLRIVVALAIVTAIVAQLLHSLDYLSGTPGFDTGFFITNFFSFFTIDSNVASVVVLLVGAGLAIGRGVSARSSSAGGVSARSSGAGSVSARSNGAGGVSARSSGAGGAGVEGRAGSVPGIHVPDADPLLFTTVRACVVTYMVTTGIVYNLLLRPISLPQGQTLEWSNEIVHVIAPIYVLLDWLFAPGRVPLNYRRLWAIVSFPIVWVVYTLIRGPLAIDGTTGKPWYPYPFLNPDTSANGYLSVTFYVLLVALVICALGVGVIWVSRRGATAGSATPAVSPT